MELAVGAMASLAPKLGGLLMEQYVVQKGLKPEIESLSKELLAMNAALVDASRVPPDQLSEVDKLWAQQIRELSYDMEDAVDDFILRVVGRKSSADTDANVFRKMVSKATTVVKKAKDRHDISGKVKDIKKLSKELAELRAKYTVRGVGANFAACTGIDPRVLNLYKKDSDLVGIEESRNKVIRMLIGTQDHAHVQDSDQSLKIVSIVGVGGLGKTTLAKTVHDMLKKTFGSCAFISVGRNPDMPRIFEKILVEVDQKYRQVDMSRWDVEQFCKELHGFLLDKRYFIVVDDIWDKESWEAIKYVLKDNNCGSRIIMTTRNFDVVTKTEEAYRLKPLSYTNSEELFYKRIQSQEGQSLDDLSTEVSRKIIGKCGGVPLAIIAIASLLVDRPCDDWLTVYDSIGFGSEDNTKKILSYSYYDLPSYLKPCLLHLGIFLEDSIISSNSVIWMWIAEGFVHLEKEEGSLFEVGERYFKELVNRSMIEPTKDEEGFDLLKGEQLFRIHDIVFDLIHELLRGENFITILCRRVQHASLDNRARKKNTDVPHSGSKVRRLLVQNHNIQRISEDTMDKPQVLRSLNIVDSKIHNMPPLGTFRVCRVLFIQNSIVPISLLKHLGRLLHLKYLEIYGTHVGDLPKEIGQLKSLQALVLVYPMVPELAELPPAVCSLTQLMCLKAEGFKSLPAYRMGNLASLEELRLNSVVGRRATDDFVVELSKLTRLRVVSIIFSEEVDESLQKVLVQSLSNLRQLQELTLYFLEKCQEGPTTWEGWEPSRKLRRLRIGGISFSRCPEWINSSCMPHLCFLSVQLYAVEVQDLNNLASLPELCHLELNTWGSWPPPCTIEANDFKNLRFCSVGTAFKFRIGVMLRLEELKFRVFAGPELDIPTKDVISDLDFGLDNLLSLEKVTVAVDCWGATEAEVQEVETMLRRAVEHHPNRPTIIIDREFEEHMISDEQWDELPEYIEGLCSVLELKDESIDVGDERLLRRLEEAVISIDCAGASMSEVEKVEAALRHAYEAIRSHPTIQLIRINTDQILSSSDHHSNTELDDHDNSPDNSLSKLHLGN